MCKLSFYYWSGSDRKASWDIVPALHSWVQFGCFCLCAFVAVSSNEKFLLKTIYQDLLYYVNLRKKLSNSLQSLD